MPSSTPSGPPGLPGPSSSTSSPAYPTAAASTDDRIGTADRLTGTSDTSSSTPTWIGATGPSSSINAPSITYTSSGTNTSTIAQAFCSTHTSTNSASSSSGNTSSEPTSTATDPASKDKAQELHGDHDRLDSKTQQKERKKMRDDVADKILADETCRKGFQERKLTDGDIRKSIKAWFKNHLPKTESGLSQPRNKGVNPFWKAMSARRVGAMRLWASNHSDEVIKKVGTMNIGVWSHTAAEMWRGLSPEEKALWEARAAEHTNETDDQCFLNQQVVLDVLGDALIKGIGYGSKQMGMCAYAIKYFYWTQNGSVVMSEMSVRLNPDCPSLANYMGGYPELEIERSLSWAHDVLPLNPGQSRPIPSGRPGASRLQYTVDGQALLPDYQPGDEKNLIPMLEALIQMVWNESERQGDMDWPAVIQSPRNFVAEVWLDIMRVPFSDLALPEAFGVWTAIHKGQQQGLPFRFKPLPGSRKMSVSVKNTPTKGSGQKQKIPLPLELAFDDHTQRLATAEIVTSEGSQATTPTTPMRRARTFFVTQPSLSDVIEDPEGADSENLCLGSDSDGNTSQVVTDVMHGSQPFLLQHLEELQEDRGGAPSMAPMDWEPLGMEMHNFAYGDAETFPERMHDHSAISNICSDTLPDGAPASVTYASGLPPSALSALHSASNIPGVAPAAATGTYDPLVDTHSAPPSVHSAPHSASNIPGIAPAAATGTYDPLVDTMRTYTPHAILSPFVHPHANAPMWDRMGMGVDGMPMSYPCLSPAHHNTDGSSMEWTNADSFGGASLVSPNGNGAMYSWGYGYAPGLPPLYPTHAWNSTMALALEASGPSATHSSSAGLLAPTMTPSNGTEDLNRLLVGESTFDYRNGASTQPGDPAAMSHNVQGIIGEQATPVHAPALGPSTAAKRKSREKTRQSARIMAAKAAGAAGPLGGTPGGLEQQEESSATVTEGEPLAKRVKNSQDKKAKGGEADMIMNHDEPMSTQAGSQRDGKGGFITSTSLRHQWDHEFSSHLTLSQAFICIVATELWSDWTDLWNTIRFIALQPPQMTYDLQSLPRPHFIPGPHRSWMVPAVDWYPKTVWDLVVRYPVFIACPTYGPPADNEPLDCIGDPPVSNIGNLRPAQTAYFDPCYFAVGCQELVDYDVAVLPPIEEEDTSITLGGAAADYFICSISFIEAALILWHESSSAFSAYVPRATLPFVELESLRPSLVSLAGCVLGIAGGLLRMRCYRELGRLYTFELSVRDDHKLITTGPYSIVRHPAYLGSFVFQAGNIVLLASKGSWFVESGLWGTLWGKAIASSAVGSMLWIALQLFLRVDEEDMVMRKEFGEEWDEWAKKTAYRLIPFVY
ncbi:transcription factor [Ganoderma sinense ZZ0214-1]|uniref:Protein-S-isoprenylcysteine O-methyltransferase n=1 Tax=Ganoderma sinense ZZ0214-1 TaxID=1077348 RepID=A0A2G8SKM2_9APHY|nr:transcription factor [Ganoderma sinense ZZ0214-1]